VWFCTLYSTLLRLGESAGEWECWGLEDRGTWGLGDWGTGGLDLGWGLVGRVGPGVWCSTAPCRGVGVRRWGV
jgi:hypothetical protein